MRYREHGSRGLRGSTLIVVAMCFLMTNSVEAEMDHLKGYKIKDLNQVVPLTNPYTLTNHFGNETCDLKKPLYFLVESEKNSGNDPFSGPAGNFVCYKAKCTGPLPPVTEADSQFGVHSLESKQAKLVCLPVAFCGDGDIDAGEVCDNNDDTACPGNCLADCTCPPQTCGNNLREGTEACDGTDATACPNDCRPDCTCAPPCPDDDTACVAFGAGPNACATCCSADLNCNINCDYAVSQACASEPGNGLCNVSVNSAGCAAECCP